MKGVVTVAESGVSELAGASEEGDPLSVALPDLGGVATTIDGLIKDGLSIDEMAQKVATWVDPSLVPALQTLATVLQGIEKYL